MLRKLRAYLDQTNLDADVVIRTVREGGGAGDGENVELLAFDDIGIAIRAPSSNKTTLLPWSRIHSLEIDA